jgi:acetylornithine deacetylase
MTTLDYEQYVTLLSTMVGCSEKLQNKPPLLIPQEKLIADIVIAWLEDAVKDNKHISFKKIEYVPGRPNLVIRYENFPDDLDTQPCKGTKAWMPKSIGFIGSHMDVVPADPKEWKHYPFKLTVDEQDPDILWGRGTTDCLGHVAMLTMLLINLAKNNIKLRFTVGVVFIADEENGDDPEIGVMHLARAGELEFLKHGPVYWLDMSDTFPTVGTGTGMTWELTVNGKRGHSGIPFNSINPVIFAMQATLGMLKVFENICPEHPLDRVYKYPCSSNMKPTQWKATSGSINQITSSAIVQGDIRLTPFYNWRDIRETLGQYVDSLNRDPAQLSPYCNKFPHSLDDEQKSRVTFHLKWLGDPYLGALCSMDSIGFKLISDATLKFHGLMDIQSCTGSLPVIASLLAAGFDMQIMGYGNGDAYHANNEYCRFSSMSTGYCILHHILVSYDKLCKATF